MIKAVIFDMDGVIIDSESDYKRIEWEMYQEMGLPVTKEEALSNMGTTCKDWWAELKRRYQFEESAEELAEREDERYVAYLFDDHIEKTMMKGADEFLKALKEKGYKTAIASSSVKRGINRVLEIFHLEEYFDVVVSGHEVQKGKPAPDVFLKAAERLAVSPEECMVIEDSYNGIVAAKTAGMQCTAYLSAPEGLVDYSKADYCIKEFSEYFQTVSL